MSYSGTNYDYGYDRYEESPLERVKQQYWTAKQTIIAKLGKKEDDSLVASDAELDSKLAVFGSIKSTCENLLKCIEHYQDYIADLAHDENALGRFLKSRGKADKTQAGKLMAAVGRAQSYTAHQRLALRVPLVRLYQELEVFTKRAVLDCYLTVEATLKARNEYRGSLLRMKDVSQQLDPDTYKQLEKFRNVQALVRKNKAKFDKLKLDCLQKIDLLAASRCNLFSQVLTAYQTCLLRFWDKTAEAHNTISAKYKGFQHYQFTVIKSLAEPSLELAMRTGGEGQEGEGKENGAGDEGELIALYESGKTDENIARTESLENLFKDSPVHEKTNREDNASIFEPRADDDMSILSLSSDVENLLNLNPSTRHSALSKGPDLGMPRQSAVDDRATDGTQFIDQLLADVNQEAPENSFSKQWQQAFGLGATFSATAPAPVSSSPSLGPKLPHQTMMPSQLLDLQPSSWSMASFSAAPDNSAFSASSSSASREASGKQKDKDKKGTKSDQRSAWFNLFADIDPLQNPDTFGTAQKDADRGC